MSLPSIALTTFVCGIARLSRAMDCLFTIAIDERLHMRQSDNQRCATRSMANCGLLADPPQLHSLPLPVKKWDVRWLAHCGSWMMEDGLRGLLIVGHDVVLMERMLEDLGGWRSVLRMDDMGGWTKVESGLDRRQAFCSACFHQVHPSSPPLRTLGSPTPSRHFDSRVLTSVRLSTTRGPPVSPRLRVPPWQYATYDVHFSPRI